MKDIYLVISIVLFSFLYSCTSQTAPAVDTVPPRTIEEKTPIIQKKELKEPIEAPSVNLNKEEIKKAETDISALITQLNKIISSKDFESWKKYLSDDYILYYSSPEVLMEKSQSPLLIKNKIVLRSLLDYFNYVVVGSRQNVKLDEIKVLDRDRIKAYMFINNTPVIIYELIRINNTWEIGKF